jgi:hypothetical protein
MYSIPDELDRLSTTFAVLHFEMSTTAELSLPRSGKLGPEAVIGARVCSEDSAIERRASSELMIDLLPTHLTIPLKTWQLPFHQVGRHQRQMADDYRDSRLEERDN